jgi:outer membrane immunogenic protein
MSIRKSLALAIAAAGAATVSGSALAQWAGPHVGLEGGGAWGQQSQSGGVFLPSPGPPGPPPSSSICTTCTADGSYNLSGGLVGGTVGYDWQNGPYVFGLEGDGSWADISGSGTCGAPSLPHGCGGSVRALGTIRARLGYDFGNASPWGGGLLAYATGGWAIGDVHAWDSLFGNSGDTTASGWTVGAGLEAKFAQNWSVKLEYLHVDLGDPAVFTAIPPNPEHVSTRFDVVRVGISYYFNGPPPPPSPPIITKATK